MKKPKDVTGTEEEELPPRLVHGRYTYFLRKSTKAKVVRNITPIWDED